MKKTKDMNYFKCHTWTRNYFTFTYILLGLLRFCWSYENDDLRVR